MYKITKGFRDQLAGYLDQSSLPHKDVVVLLKALLSLEEIKEPNDVKKDGK